MVPSNSIYLTAVVLLFKIGLVVFALFYFFFTLIVIRQVRLMIETITTAIASGLQALSVFYSLVALGVVIFLIITLF